jgi:serine/threonine protein kinase/TolB-like protein
MIDINRYRRIDEIFQAALELEPRARASYISEACSGDAALLKEVESLLSSDDQDWELIGTPAFEMLAPLLAKDQPELEAGDSIGHYQIVSLLGVGGMGQVYLAEDAKLRRKVALKLLPTSYTRDDSRLRRFQQEARAASALNHPNILTIHELGEVNGEQFIATEFVEGETLRERLQRAPLTLAETLEVAVQIAGALAAAHKAGIVHRDIKPENIMLRHDGYVKVLDFGLAKLTEQPEPATPAKATENVDISSGLVLGTVKYMSPEQAAGRHVDPRSDIFSFGVVLYEMLAGRPPFAGKDSRELISAILKKEPSPLTDVREEIQHLISRTLCKKREDRFQTIEDLLADLKSLKDKTVTDGRSQHHQGRGAGSAFSTREIPAISTATTIEFINKIKRHKTRTVLGFATLIILLAGAGYLGKRYFFSRRAINVQPAGIAQPAKASEKSIAVLPFANESGDAKLEYLSEGLSGDLIETLQKVPGLEVKALSTVVRYKGANSDAQKIGQELKVDVVMVSQLIKTGKDLALRVELVDSRNGNSLGGQKYPKKVSELVVLQSELARDIIQKLSVPVTIETQEKLAKHDTKNYDAYLRYLNGVFYARKVTEQDIKKAIEFFSQAIQKDPEYARAYAALAMARHSLTLCCDGQPSELLQAKVEARKAVELDDELGEGHSALGAVIYQYDWKFVEAEKEFKRALDLDPNSAMSHFLYSDFLARMGRNEEGTFQKDRAAELEPFEPFFACRVGGNKYKDPEKKLKQILYAIGLDPKFYFSHLMAAGVYKDRGEYNKAIEEARFSKTLSPDQTWSDVSLSNILVLAGRPEEARAILDELLERSKSRFVPPYHIASVYNQLDDKEQALYWLQQAYEIRDPKMTFLKTMPWKNVRDDPRFKDLMRRVGFVEDK